MSSPLLMENGMADCCLPWEILMRLSLVVDSEEESTESGTLEAHPAATFEPNGNNGGYQDRGVG